MESMPGGAPAAAVQEVARTTLVQGLRDAHAMEKQSAAMISNGAKRLESYPAVEAGLRRHLAETERQIERLDGILGRMGESASPMKDAAAGFVGTMAQLTQAIAADEVLKNGLAMFAFESFEAASYEQLLSIASAAGALDAVEPLKQSLSEERAMADWLGGSSREVVHRFLELSAEGGRQAGR